ncbi:MAG TPA: carboxypeptidase-like regulatory domain-containing protein [Blastocatellia bacterium]|nr:carboxypeptidase-like regulatory domain-containing protein [Blastocatellia bacterium]
MKLRLIGLILPLTALAASSAVSTLGQPARERQSDAPQKKSVVARGRLIGTREYQQLITWKTGYGRAAIAHLAIETTGPNPRILWQADERFPATNITSIRATDLDGDGAPEIIGLWSQSAATGSKLRVFRLDRSARTFVELQPKSEQELRGTTEVQRYQLLARGARQRIIVYRRAATGWRVVEDGGFEVRGSEIVRAGGGVPVTPQGESGIEGQTVISPARPGPLREGDSSSAPFQTTLVVLSAGNSREVARVETGSDGRFRISLPPGEYRIGPPPEQPRKRFPRGGEQTVKVEPGRFTRVTLEFDSGMR